MPSAFINITNDLADDAARDITRLLDAHAEWFCTEETSTPHPSSHSLRRLDCDVSAAHRQIVFSFLGTHGLCVRHIRAWSYDGKQIKFQVAAHRRTSSTLLTLTPRASIADDAAQLEHARLEACARLAHAALASLDDASWKIQSCALSATPRRTRPGKFARVILARGRSRIILTCDLTNAAGQAPHTTRPATDSLLASSLLWFVRLAARPASSRKIGKSESGKNRIDNNSASSQLWLVASGKHASEISLRCACLRPATRDSLRVWRTNDDLTALAAEPIPTLDDAVHASVHTSVSHFTRAAHRPTSLAESIRALAPEAIDVIPARHGETLRFHGLAFARLRHLMNHEHLWLGTSGDTRAPTTRTHFQLDADDAETTAHAWQTITQLIRELAAARRHDSKNRRHTLFHLAPESWLESLLRRDITRLDAGLRLAPLHAQLRTAHTASPAARPVDLLAIRQDGRLVVIELKVAEDDALPLQAADYWRRIETLRRTGHIAPLFENARLADSPPLVYVVAPLLRFARSFDALAELISPRIELYRFDINEDWRAGVRVMRRARVSYG